MRKQNIMKNCGKYDKESFYSLLVLFIIILLPFIKLLKEYQLGHVVSSAEQKLLTILPVFFRDLNLSDLLVLKNTPIINSTGIKTENTIKYLLKSKSTQVQKLCSSMDWWTSHGNFQYCLENRKLTNLYSNFWLK